MEDQPKELGCLYDNTDNLILSLVPDDFLEFDDLPMEDGETLLTVETNDLEMTQGSGPNPADTNPGLISGDATDSSVVLRELFPKLKENQEAGVRRYRARCCQQSDPNGGQTSMK